MILIGGKVRSNFGEEFREERFHFMKYALLFYSDSSADGIFNRIRMFFLNFTFCFVL